MSELTVLDGPDLRRADAATVFVGQRHVPNRADAHRELERTAVEWSSVPWPAGILSFSCYLSVEEDTVLTYVQCAGGNSAQLFVRSFHERAGAGSVEYRLTRSVLPPGSSGSPACVVIATFDVDGAERQERVVSSLVEALDGMPPEQSPGMLSANFHASIDGTRVLNYAEWTSDDAHLAFLDSATRVTTMRVSGDVPGVRPIGFKRYHLHRSITV
ncbi:antibiotic biosynthesis monooxygenase [Streptomyces pinistramenti]|uniref:antibiotic biosynthesis monooxygenase n=1 Tax=Streptomyces pinistramenti TaxID=2884812 RepID=UPI001D07315E|nr:antibiotic biosynthesis monooxygenase [Streptomyces pinistramenti]MCB5909987.1 antibiotic biosynthesis monooxygenase [Streptomyces pinistramenti]